MSPNAVPPPRTATYHSLQAGRAIAALLVVLVHAGGTLGLPKYLGENPTGAFFEFGIVAVDFFFVLSGFIIMHAHRRDIGKPAEVMPYFWKRFARVFPPYWVVLALIVPVFFLVPTFGEGHERDPGVVVCSVFLLKHPVEKTILVVAWTMIFEMLFYVVFGSLVLHRRLGAIVFAAWSVGVLAFSWFESYPWNFLFSPWFLRVLAGVGAAVFLEHARLPTPRLAAVAGVLILMAIGIVHVRGPLSAPVYDLGGTLGALLAVAGLAEAERGGRIRVPGLLVYLGDATYAIYLVHFPALSVLAKLTMLFNLHVLLPGILLFGVHTALAVGAGCAFHELAEKPLHRWSRQFFRRRDVRPADAPTSESPLPLRKAA